MSVFTLYRFYAADDQLLYVGLSVNPGRRMEKHKSTQPWWSEVARIEMEQHPDMATLRQAEREAIETEKPAYNVRMNDRTSKHLIWTCDVCKQPIPDHDGYLTVNYGEISAHDKAHQDFDDAHRNENGWIVYSLDECVGLPDPAVWKKFHRGCDPNIHSNDYWIGVERIRTETDVLHWTGHLLGKNWIQSTTWPDLLRGLA